MMTDKRTRTYLPSLLLLIALLLSRIPAAAAEQQGWQKNFSTGQPTVVRSMVETPDGGYLLVGATRGQGTQWYDGWLARLNSNGVLQWEKQFGGVYDDWFSSVVLLPGGDYLLAGGSDPEDNPNHSDAWLVRLDKDGKLLWQRSFVGNGEDAANAVIPTENSGSLLVGRTGSTKNDQSDGWVIKLDADGKKLWERNFGSELMSADAAPDGGFLISGQTCFARSVSETGCVGLLARLDNHGTILWQHETPEDYSFADILSAHGQDGRFLLAGNKVAAKGNSSTRLLFLHPVGNNVQEMILPVKFDGMVQALIPTREGGYAMAGIRSSKESPPATGWFDILGGNGTLISELSLKNEPGAILQNRSGSFLLAGRLKNGNGTGWWAIKLKQNGSRQQTISNE